MNIKKLREKLGKLAIVEVSKALIRTVWYTVAIEECTECHRKYPAFNFEIMHMWPNPEDDKNHGVSLCRNCYNKIVASPDDNELWEDYYVHFNPVSSFISIFKWNWDAELKMTLTRLKYEKIRKKRGVID
jgi:hypothetical protein